MVIISKPHYFIIKRVFWALSLSLLSLTEGMGQDTLQMHRLPAVERAYQFYLYQKRYGTLPSLISEAPAQGWTYAQTAYLHAQGSFTHPQDYKRLKGLALSTASLAPLKDTGWTLYGGLSYQNTRKEDIGMNLSYGIRGYGSPYYFFRKKEGLWNHQTYAFKTSADYRINRRLSLGADLNYSTDLYYRKTDTRNETVALGISGVLSVSYWLNPKHLISMGVGMDRFKASMDLSNRYQHKTSDLTYNIYFNTGLGSYLKNITRGAETHRHLPELRLHWLRKSGKHDLSILFTTKSGEEKWIDETIHKAASNNVFSRYSITDYAMGLLHNRYYQGTLFALAVEADYLRGKGRVWDIHLSEYMPNYTNTTSQASVDANVFRYHKIVSQLGVGLSYLNQDQQDKNYGYRMGQQIIRPTVKGTISKALNERIRFSLPFESGYRHVMDMKHRPYAAKNIYPKWIGYPVAGYLGTDVLEMGIRPGIEIQARGRELVVCRLRTRYQRALKAVVPTGGCSQKKGHHTSYSLEARVYF